jgi:hypothetical protein
MSIAIYLYAIIILSCIITKALLNFLKPNKRGTVAWDYYFLSLQHNHRSSFTKHTMPHTTRRTHKNLGGRMTKKKTAIATLAALGAPTLAAMVYYNQRQAEAKAAAEAKAKAAEEAKAKAAEEEGAEEAGAAAEAKAKAAEEGAAAEAKAKAAEEGAAAEAKAAAEATRKRKRSGSLSPLRSRSKSAVKKPRRKG